jgi:hypothetical protein
MFLSVDGRRSRVSSSGASQGAHRQCFLALMVGAPVSPAPVPPKGPTVDIFSLMVDALKSPSAPTRGGPPSMFISIDGGRS